MSNKRWLSGCAGALLLVACSETPNTVTNADAKPFINPPIPELAPAFNTFEIQADKDEVIQLANGTTIRIKAGTLADSAGNAIRGKATILYREFHDAADVLLSGIPMRYNENGKTGDFQTAGMFDIRAKQQDKSLTIAANQSIEVQMASWESGDDYNFYQLEETGDNKGWRYKGRSQADVNVSKKQKVDKINKKLASSLKLDKELFIFSFDAVLDVDYGWATREEDKVSMSKLKAQKYDIDMLNVKGSVRFQHRGNWYESGLVLWRKINPRAYPSWLATNEEFYNFQFKPVGNGRFQVELSQTPTSKPQKLLIEFVMPLEKLFSHPADYWKNNYKEAFAEVEAELERWKTQADVFRTFKISGFGIYNHDKLMQADDAILTNIDFKFGNSPAETFTTIFYLPEDNKTVISISKGEQKLLPNNRARLFAVLPGGKIALYKGERYQKIDFAALRKQAKPAFTFEMEILEQKINSAQILRTVLAS